MVLTTAGLLAALMAYVLNRILLRVAGNRVIVLVVPFVEELAKTGSAVLLGSALIATHGLFGVVEAFHDVAISRKHGLEAGMVSIAGHLVFGLITRSLVGIPVHWVYAALATGMVHALWNSIVLRWASDG